MIVTLKKWCELAAACSPKFTFGADGEVETIDGIPADDWVVQSDHEDEAE